MIRPAGGLYRRMKPQKPRLPPGQPLPLAADLPLSPEEFVRFNYPPPLIDLSGAQLPAVVTNGLSQVDHGAAARAEFERPYALTDLLPDLKLALTILQAERGSPFDMWTGGDFLTKLGAKTLYRQSLHVEQLIVEFPNKWGASIVTGALVRGIELMVITFPEEVIEDFTMSTEQWSRQEVHHIVERLREIAGRPTFTPPQIVDVSDPATPDSQRISNAIARRLLGSPDQENNSP